MSVETKITGRLAELVNAGRQVLATRESPSPGHITSDFVDVQLANQWLTSCQSFLSRVFGPHSVHAETFQRHFKSYPKWPDVEQAFGVLLAAQQDYERDALFEVKRVIEADVFNDFLEQAEHLFSLGYYQPAAVIAGSVLEDGLRKLCVRDGVVLPEKPKLDWMNAQLAKQGVYNMLTQKKITALADLRNNAAHGKWTEFTEADVKIMIRDVRDFMERHYA